MRYSRMLQFNKIRLDLCNNLIFLMSEYKAFKMVTREALKIAMYCHLKSYSCTGILPESPNLWKYSKQYFLFLFHSSCFNGVSNIQLEPKRTLPTSKQTFSKWFYFNEVSLYSLTKVELTQGYTNLLPPKILCYLFLLISLLKYIRHC